MTEAAEQAATRSGIEAWVRAVRPEQWTKNLLVFAALIFGLRLGEPQAVVHALIAFVAFCAASSGGYLLNDVRDLERDRLHPTKRKRPIASGAIAVPAGLIGGAILIVGAGGPDAETARVYTESWAAHHFYYFRSYHSMIDTFRRIGD